MHFELVEELKISNETISLAKSRKESNEALIYQIMILSISAVLSWVPSNITYVIAIFLDKYPIEMITWTIIFLVPVNSIVTQSVFILTTVKKFHILDCLYHR